MGRVAGASPTSGTGGVISRDEALLHSAEAYRRFLEAHPDILDWLVGAPADVYDLEPRDVESGPDCEVRRRGAAGEPIDALVPPRVAELIAARRPYRSGAAR